MQEQPLKYVGNEFIENDLKRLKVISSLADDVKDAFNVICGYVEETNWPPLVDFCGGLITELPIEGEIFKCYKDRVPNKKPRFSPSKGCRLIYALGTKSKTFIPLLVFRSNEEGTMYAINNKQFKITSSNFGKIINEKLK